MDAPIDRLLASAEGSAVLWPAAYDLGWTAILVVGTVAVVWTIVSVVRSSLSDRATVLWVLLVVFAAPVAVIAWLVLGRDARASGRELRARRPARAPTAGAR